MATAAIERALQVSLLSPTSLDAVLFAGVMPEQPMPSTAILIRRRLRARANGVTCFDINASCAGFLKCLEIAAVGVSSGLWRYVRIAAAELASKDLQWDDVDPARCSAMAQPGRYLGHLADEGVVTIRNATFSEGAELSVTRTGGSRFNMRTAPPSSSGYLFAMNGRGLLRLTQTRFPAFLEELRTPRRR
jgi:3-oxoacyl-[acyl-carrier-protein] synthase-3